MKRRLLLLLAGLLLALAILPPALPLLVDTRPAKARLEAALGQALGVPVAIRGGLGLRLLPFLELRVGGLEIGKEEQGARVACREARVRVSLVRLVQRRVLFRRVSLDGLSVRLEQGGDKGLDWPGLKAHRGFGLEQGGFVFEGLSSLTISEGGVSLRNAASGLGVTLDRLQLRYRKGSGFLSLSTNLRLDLPTGVRFSRLEAAVSSVGALRMADGAASIQGLDVRSGLVLLSRDGAAVTGQLDALLDLDWASRSLSLTGLELALGELRLNGSLQGRDLLSSPLLRGAIRADSKDAARLAKALGLPTPAVALGSPVPFQAEADLTADAQGLELGIARAVLGGSDISGRIARRGWSAPSWAVELAAAKLDFDELRPAAWPEPAAGQSREQGQGLGPVLERLRALRLDLDLRADEIVSHGVRGHGFQASLRAKDGRLEGGVARIGFQGGEYSSTVLADVDGQGFRLALDGRLTAHHADLDQEPDHRPASSSAPGRSPGPASGDGSAHTVLRPSLRVTGTPQSFSGSLDIPRCDLRELFHVLGVEPHEGMADNALRQASLNMDFAGGGDGGLRIPSAVLMLDGMRLEGSGSATGQLPARMDFDLKTRRLNLAPYLPALTRRGTGASGSPGSAPGCLPPIHPACPAISGTLTVGEALLPDVKLSGLKLMLDMTGKSLRLRAESAQVLDGRASARLDVDVAGQGAMADLEAYFQGLDAASLSVLLGREGLLTGRLSGSLRAGARAGSLEEALRTLRLTAEAEARAGRLSAVDGQGQPFSRLAAKLIVAGSGVGAGSGVQTVKAGARAAPYAYRCSLDLDADLPSPALVLDLGTAGELRVEPDGSALAVDSAGFRLSAKGPALRDERNSLVLRGGLTLDTAKSLVELSGLSLSGPGLNGKGRLRAEPEGGQLACEGSLALERFNPRQTLERAGISLRPMRDPTALSTAQVNLDFSLRERRLDIPRIELELDGFRLAGNAHVPDMDQPRMLFDLAGTSFDFDRYRAPPSKRRGPPGEKDALRLPLDLLSRLSFKGRLRLERLRIYHLLFEHGEAMLEADGGVYVAKPVTAEFFEGPARGEFKAVATPERFSFETRASALKVSFGSFLDTMAGGQYVRGPTDVYLTLRASGATNLELIETLSGNGRLEVENGSISFSPEDDPPDGAAIDLSSLHGDERKFWEIPEDVRRRGRTRFSRATANVLIDNGVARNTDLLVRSPVLRGTGEGFVDIGREIVDYTIVFELVNAARVPLYFEGDFDRLKVGVRPLAVIGDTATGIVRKPFDILFGILPGIERLLPDREPSERRVR